MPSEPLLEARGVGRSLRGNQSWLLRSISLQLRPGDRLCVVGPTGAGKTLLLRALALLDQLDSGAVLWRGATVSGSDVPRFRSRVAYFPQRAVLFEGSVEDNLQRPWQLALRRGQSFDRARILRYLTLVARDEALLHKSHSDLSGGETQLVCLLRVLQLDPDILLLDEPTASLDAQTTRAVENLVEQWMDESPQQRALLWVTHDRDQAARVGRRLVEMRDGELVEADA